MHGHIVAKSVYFLVFFTLLALTALTTAIAFVDLGAMNTVAALAIALVMAPIPPMAKEEEPAGKESEAARISSTVLLPADHGPRNAPKMPRVAIVARSWPKRRNPPISSTASWRASCRSFTRKRS